MVPMQRVRLLSRAPDGKDLAQAFGVDGESDGGFDRAVAATHDHHAAGRVTQGERLAAPDDLIAVDLEAGERHHDGARGHDDVLGLDGVRIALFRRDLHDTGRRDAAPPLDWQWDTYDGEVPEDAGTMAELVAAYEGEYNAGHAAELAALYTDDAMAAFADGPWISGRSALQAQLQTNIETGTIVTIHDVMTQPLGDGWAADAGWYQLNAADGGDPVRYGNYMNLLRQQEDGTWKIHWMVTNGWPAASQEDAERLQ